MNKESNEVDSSYCNHTPIDLAKWKYELTAFMNNIKYHYQW